MSTEDGLRNEPTERVDARIPRSVIARARTQFPELNDASLIRVALARLTGLPSDPFMTRLSNGPKRGSGRRVTAA